MEAPISLIDKELAGTHGARPGALGFLTDTTLCIGCKACEVACKQWNQLPMDHVGFTGHSYDHTSDLSATTWRHVAFVERINAGDGQPHEMPPFQSNWLMLSDVCKHCVNAGCLQACPTGAIIRTEIDTVVVQQEICNGCGYCVPSCPFGVIDRDHTDGRAAKCTLCYDRLEDGLEPACAKACPTDSIQFGFHDELVDVAERRVAQLHSRGLDQAYLYGASENDVAGGLGAFFLLTEPPEVYGLPADAESPIQENVIPATAAAMGAGLLAAAGVAASFVLSARRPRPVRGRLGRARW
jgi:formate dehydrogenase iron-sulfur subunit